MTDNTIVVFHGFLNLNGKEKLALVESINEYFDSNDREPIRAENERAFALVNPANGKGGASTCKCCGR